MSLFFVIFPSSRKTYSADRSGKFSNIEVSASADGFLVVDQYPLPFPIALSNAETEYPFALKNSEIRSFTVIIRPFLVKKSYGHSIYPKITCGFRVF